MNDQVCWEQCCRDHGLLLTTPRRAIIRALLQQDQPVDAVTLQRISRQNHASTSLATVYRFLRELHALNLLQAHVPTHGRTCWSLRSPSASGPMAPAESVAAWLRAWRAFMRDLESVGLAEAQASGSPPGSHATQPDNPSTIHEMLQALASHLGYRLT